MLASDTAQYYAIMLLCKMQVFSKGNYFCMNHTNSTQMYIIIIRINVDVRVEVSNCDVFYVNH